eukprot:CAMPEP_0113619774 /NCGR_PEP_ID=MMETSP0017_2-20120614/10053_1 /TAXON_ID=2856 /ORGANISM="Cylindrotheca closterium" /LENGTH=193 /DNA_ID=CAMNT_0000529379 /DNA_START=39 /DNA_END=620 /DNA_ORIENTATION=+ /assembly_acc=CAM_ASM_000147
MKTVILASLIASAAAFAPAQQAAHSTTTSLQAKEDYVGAIGVQAPLGVWDPLSILDTCSEEKYDRLRATELKHGRVAMLGVVGYLVTYAGVRWPGLEDVPAGWAAWKALPTEVVGQMVASWIFMEIANRDQTGEAEFDGDFRNGYLDFGWDSQSDAWKTNKRAIELNQGRAAQMGLLGLMVHDAMGNVKDILP